MKNGNIFPVKNRLKELRNEKKLTQTELQQTLESRGCSLTLRTLRNYEKGGVIPSDVLICLSDLFNCSADYLLGRSDCRTVNNALIRQETGLSEGSIETLGKHKDNDVIKTIDLLLSRLGSGDLLTIITTYLNRPEGSNTGDIYFYGGNGQDIVIPGETVTNGGLLAAVTSLLTEYRADIQGKKPSRKGRKKQG